MCFGCPANADYCICRVGIVAKGGLGSLLRVLAAVEDLDPTSTDTICSTLCMLTPQGDDLGCRVRVWYTPV